MRRENLPNLLSGATLLIVLLFTLSGTISDAARHPLVQ